MAEPYPPRTAPPAPPADAPFRGLLAGPGRAALPAAVAALLLLTAAPAEVGGTTGPGAAEPPRSASTAAAGPAGATPPTGGAPTSVSGTVRTREVEADSLSRREALVRWARSWYPGRSGDIMLVPRRGDMLTGSAPYMHGSPWPYDADVPLLMAGPGHVASGRHPTAASHEDLGATLAALLGLSPRPGADGAPLARALATAGPAEGVPPVVALVVLDAFRADYLERYADSLPNLRRLAREGASFPNAGVSYLPTATAAAHATISTAATPALHGVVGNDLVEPGSDRARNVFAGADPSALSARALADRWSAATRGGAVIYAQGGTYYPATALAGHGGCAPGGRPAWMAWWDAGQGRWATSPECHRLPDTLRALEPEQAWRGTDGGRAGHDVTGPRSVRSSALFARIEGEAARAALSALPFGRDTVPDLLLVNLKATDYTAHRYGPDAPQTAAALAEADRQVGRLLEALERAAGPGGWALAVTGDHGMAPEPARGRSRHGYREVHQLLRERFDPDGPGIVRHLGGADHQLYLDRERMEALGVGLREVARTLEEEDWIFAAFPADEVRAEARRLRRARRRPGPPSRGSPRGSPEGSGRPPP